MNAQIDRRRLLSLAPTALAVGAVPAMALPVETPIAAMHREIARLQTIANDRNVSSEVGDEACDRMMDLVDAILDLPATSADDMLRKIMGHTVNGDQEIGDGNRGGSLWAEARALIA